MATSRNHKKKNPYICEDVLFWPEISPKLSFRLKIAMGNELLINTPVCLTIQTFAFYCDNDVTLKFGIDNFQNLININFM